MAGMRAVPGLVDVDTTLSVRQPELRVQIDREKASDFGINVREHRRPPCAPWSAASRSRKFKEEQEQYDVWLRAELPNRDDPQAPSAT